MTEHQKANRIKYLVEYITGWEYKDGSKAPAKMYEELKRLESEERTDRDKFIEERDAASKLRDELCWAVGYISDDPNLRVVSDRIEKALKEHDANRCQRWF